MKRSMWFLVSAVGVAVIAYLLLPGTGIRGRLAGEAFFARHPTSYWSHKLRSNDPQVQDHARNRLTEGGADAVPVLRELLREANVSAWQSAEVRSIAVEIVTQLGPEASAVAPTLLDVTHDEDPLVRTMAAVALPAVNCSPDQAVPRLSEMLREDPTPKVLRALSEYGPDAASAIEILSSVLQDTSLASDVRWNAARTLGKIRAPAASAIPVLVAHLDDETDTIREHCAEALGDIGAPARHTATQLLAKLTDPAYRVRKDAARSLGQIGADPATTVPELKKLLEDEEQIVRDFARTAIRALAPQEPLPPVTDDSAQDDSGQDDGAQDDT